MADFKQNQEDAQEYYETQLKIAEVIKEQTDTWSSYNDAVKQGAKNAREMKQIQAELAKLTNATTAEEKAKKAELEKQLKYLQQYNKELLSTKTAMTAIGKSVSKWGMDKLVGMGTQLLDRYDKLERASRSVAINQGMSVARMHQFRKSVAETQHYFTNLGFEVNAMAEMMGSMNQATGTQIMLSEGVAIKMAEISKRTGIAHTEIAGMAGEMMEFGMGSTTAAQSIENIEDASNKMGVNTQKVLKSVQNNLKLVNKLNFKGGIVGMAKVAAFAEKYKINMEEVAGFAERVFRPEGAIEAAANLQVLGGSLAQMGDPFQLMYQARNAPDELTKSITKAAASTAQWNKETKEFEVTAYELDRLKEASAATGISIDTFVAAAKKTAKMNMFEDALKFDPNSEGGQFLSSIMDMDEKGSFVIDVDGNKQYLKDLSSTQQQALAEELKAKEVADAKRQEEIQSTQERVINMSMAMLDKLLPLIQKFDDAIRGPLTDAMKWIYDALVNNPWLVKLVAGLIAFSMAWKFLSPLFGPLVWFMRGRMLAKGFNMGVKQNQMMSQMAGGAGGQGKFYKGGQFMPGGGRAPKGGMMAGGAQGAQGAQGAGAMGQAAGSQATNMIAGAAAILILAAALFVFAKALQEFEKLQNGWSTLLLAAASLTVLGIALKLLAPTLQSFGTQAWPGIAAMGALAVSVMALGYATTLFAQGGFAGTMLMIVALAALTVAIAVLGGLGMSGIGFIGVALILALGVAMIAMGYAVMLAAQGMAILVEAFTGLFSIVSMENIIPMMLLGPTLLGIAAGMFVLAGAFVALGASMLMGGFLALIGLNETAQILHETFQDIDAQAVAQAITAINNVDEGKIEKIKELAGALSMVGLFGSRGIKIDFGDVDISGEIELKGGGDSAKMVMQEPHLTKLKDLIWDAMEKGKNAGKL